MKLFNKYKLIGIVVFLVFFSSCERDFDDINIDPNSPVAVPPENLLTNALFNLTYSYWDRDLNFEFGELMVQHMAQNEYTEEQNYSFAQANFDFRWGNLYAGWDVTSAPQGGMYDLIAARHLIEIDETIPADIKANKLAIIDIFLSFSFQMVTDLWGNVPYSQAFKPSEYPAPTYDSQADIYAGMITTVTDAVNAINVSADGFTSGDILFDGNMAAWKNFGNALLLRMGMRISEANSTLAQSTVSAALGASLPSGDVMFVFDGANQDLANPFYQDRIISTRDDFRISEILVNQMKANNDPRLVRYADPAPGGTDIIGMPYGLNDGGAFALKNSTSDIHESIENDPTAPAYLISIAEIEFFRAEAIARGWVTGSAQDAYNAAITASMNQWGVDPADIATYLAEPGVAYNTSSLATELESIAEQKWVALYTNGVEAYAEWRRLDFPVLSPGSGAFESSIPLRMLYPVTEDGTNGESLAAAGDNTLFVAVWWDK
ncbi:MAG: SusD/RagB family nutrient-binding outer membrane lipoprotein [Cyclobacteriaceae bacterium]|nr:SusD/RagB family nutrient-binding outer membrane lipoprotein [Cyclobacteriaceae bacterium]